MLRDYESFDDIGGSLTRFVEKGWNFGGNSPVIQTIGRFGTYGFRSADNSVFFSKDYDAQPTWIIGFAFTNNVISSASFICAFYDTVGANYQISLTLDGAGRIQLRRGAGGGTILATGTKLLLPGIYNYIEVKLTIHDSTGSAEVRVNELTDITVSGVDTKNTSNASADRIYFHEISGTHRGYYDDIYVCDGQGSAPFNDFLGDCRVQSLLPSGNGNSSQLVGQDADSTNNYQNVDDPTGPDDDTTYNESSTVGNKDTYVYGDLESGSGTVYAVKPNIRAKKDDAGARSIASVARLSGTEVDSSNASIGTSYGYYSDIRTTKPGGGTWSIADVNNAEFGVKITA